MRQGGCPWLPSLTASRQGGGVLGWGLGAAHQAGVQAGLRTSWCTHTPYITPEMNCLTESEELGFLIQRAAEQLTREGPCVTTDKLLDRCHLSKRLCLMWVAEGWCTPGSLEARDGSVSLRASTREGPDRHVTPQLRCAARHACGTTVQDPTGLACAAPKATLTKASARFLRTGGEHAACPVLLSAAYAVTGRCCGYPVGSGASSTTCLPAVCVWGGSLHCQDGCTVSTPAFLSTSSTPLGLLGVLSCNARSSPSSSFLPKGLITQASEVQRGRLS